VTDRPTHKGCIFIIEDNLINMKLIKDILTVHNYHIIEAYDGNEAIQKMEAHQTEIDLVLMDIQLPEINGLELIKRFKENEQIAKVPIIVLSAHAMESDMEKALCLGAADYITKPINIEDFVSCIEQYLNQ
jgi:CheY-like chemotaxis protein